MRAYAARRSEGGGPVASPTAVAGAPEVAA